MSEKIAAKIGIIGDYSIEVRAHAAIPVAVQRAALDLGGAEVELRWLGTNGFAYASRAELEELAGLWAVPGSPYENMTGALRAIGFARETGRPFLGTCGGFQHALIEYARAALGMPEAEHAESTPGAAALLIDRLSCSLVGVRAEVRLAHGSALAAIYGSSSDIEEYQCSYGLSPRYRELFASSALRFTAFDTEGSVRGFELASHPFFIGTLFQPERSALAGRHHPLVTAFVRAGLAFEAGR